MKTSRCLLMLCILMASGCASGPKYVDVASAIPPIESGNGRVYIYRPQASFLYVGSITLNGEEVRVPSAGGFLFVDRTPGEYEVVVDAVTTERTTFELGASEERYIRVTVDAGGYFLYTIVPRMTDKAEAFEEMQDLRYIGKLPGTQ